MGGSTWTAEGYLRVPARIARPGILVYQTPGGTVRELVPASTLSDPEFLASLTGKPLTLEHPPAPLTPDTVGEYRVGTILSVEYIEGQGVIAQVQIENREAIKAVQAGKLEVSPSYITDTAPTPGVDPAFGRYDVIQTRRFAGNHVALTDLGRGGRDVRLLLRADSAEVEIEVGIEIPLSGEKMKLSPAVLALLATCGIDPAPFADDAAAIAAATEKMKEIQASNAAANVAAESMDALPAAVEMVAEAGPEMPVDACGPKMDSAIKGKRAANHEKTHKSFVALSHERVRMDSMAKELGIEGAEKLGLSALRKAVVLKLNPKARQDGDASYYKACLDMTGARMDSAQTPWKAASDALNPENRKPEVKQDSAAPVVLTQSQASAKALAALKGA